MKPWPRSAEQSSSPAGLLTFNALIGLKQTKAAGDAVGAIMGLPHCRFTGPCLLGRSISNPTIPHQPQEASYK